MTDKSRSDRPWLVLTGDCLFVGDVGRPDLAGREHLEEQVDSLYDSLYNKIAQLWQISAVKLKQKLGSKRYKRFLDVRTHAEWEVGHIKEATHFPLPDLLRQPPNIPKDGEVIITCGIGYRGNIAASFLQGQGFQHVHSLAGGMKAWVNAGHLVEV